MLDSLKQIAKNVIGLNADLIAVTIYKGPDIIKAILDFNRLDQLAEGLNTEGEIIGYYSAFTDYINEGSSFNFGGNTYTKLEGEPYNFIDTTEFFTSFYLRVDKDGFTIVADDDKEDGALSDRYKNLLGLTDESKSKLAQQMLPLFIKEVRGAIFKEIS